MITIYGASDLPARHDQQAHNALADARYLKACAEHLAGVA